MLRQPQVRSRDESGVTLVELLITLTVAATLLTLALPAFTAFRERSLFRGTTDQVLGLVQLARFESVQRDRPVTVTVLTPSPVQWCVGANEGAVACNCFETNAASADFCEVARFPALNGASPLAPQAQAQQLLRGVQVVGAPNFGGANRFTINPKLGTLDDPVSFGSLLLRSPTDALAYRSRIDISPLARATACAPDSHSHTVGFTQCPP
ncbi:MAG: GspH/FimT family pseudopilin [Xanthomonadales bacterium]|nr:GspH/FimT family pseudopilin [Xanthomonadales bacterium]MCB1642822.1 GspH/FimT family pseudopilin [Xanthomonadales bacterium]